MITTDLTTLKINKLTKAQYEAAIASGNINENELYMTPESEEKSGGVFIINLTSSTAGDGTTTVSSDKTYSEIKSAYNEGKACFLRNGLLVYSLVFCDIPIYFSTVFENTVHVLKLTASDGIEEWSYFSYTISQPDWNVNDETSSEYIKNRPFYTSDPVERYIVQNPSFSQSTTSDDGTVKQHIFSSLIELVVGTKYTVYFGSTSYECICSLIESASCLGNSSILGIGNNTGEPFFIYTDNSTQTIIATTDTSETPSVSISTIASKIVKIDEKYLPVSAFTNAEWDYISGKPIEDTVDINISVSNFTQTFDSITTGSVYSNKLFDEELLLESGYTYRVTGRISLVSEGIGNTYYLSIDDYFTCESNGYLNLGAIYCPFHKKELGIKLYGSNSYSNNNKLCFIGYNFTEKQTITVEELNIVSKTKTLDKKYIPNVFLFKDNPKCTGSFSLNRYPNSNVGSYSFAEGYMSKASGKYSHAEGNETVASGECSHSEGVLTTSSGKYSHAEGNYTIASSLCQHVQGKCNVPDDSNTYLHIVGNGRDFASRSNAATLDWSGNAWYAGDVYVGSTSGTNKDSGSKKLATEEYVSSLKSTVTTTTLTASKWDSTSRTYSFEATYPNASYDIEVDIDGDRCTDEQLDAWIAAKPLSSSANKIVAKGDIPTVDIPVILTITPK